MCTIMRSMDPKEFDIHLVLVSDSRDLAHLVPEYVRVHELSIPNVRKSLFEYIKKMKSIQPDAVFTTTTRTYVLAALGKQFIPSHCLISRYPNMPSQQIRRGDLKSWRLLLTKCVCNYADIVIAQTDEMAEELENYLNINKCKIRTVLNPIDRNHIDRSLENQQNPFDPGIINIVASGRLVEQKGFDVLLKAFSIIKEKLSRANLHIFGEDAIRLKEQLIQQATHLNILDSVRFHGFVSNPYPFYKYCDLFVLSSRWEGCPNVLLECLYLGKRVVATKCVPIIERIVPPELGKLVDVDDIGGLAMEIYNSLMLPTATKCDHLNVSDSDREFVQLFR